MQNKLPHGGMQQVFMGIEESTKACELYLRKGVIYHGKIQNRGFVGKTEAYTN